jgi:hypothetical protein
MRNLALKWQLWPYFIVVICQFANAKELSVEPWFQSNECQELTIKKFESISNDRVLATVVIKDPLAIRNLVNRIESLEPNGDELISFGPNAESIDLNFLCQGKTQKIEIYERKFKTPSTGFNSKESVTESELYRDIDALLFPEFGKAFLKIPNLEIKFKTFSVTYLESRKTQDEHVANPINNDVYLLNDGNGQTKTVEVIAGQTPSAPLQVRVGGINFHLVTSKTQEGQQLYPSYFQIVK